MSTGASNGQGVISTPGPSHADAEATTNRASVLPAMGALRETADALERVVADDLWPLPTYQEMLFMR